MSSNIEGVKYVPQNSEDAGSDAKFVPETGFRGKRKAKNKGGLGRCGFAIAVATLCISLAGLICFAVWIYNLENTVEKQGQQIEALEAIIVREEIEENQNRLLEAAPKEIELDICALQMDQGPCFSSMQRWYFDTGRKKCLQFSYGGCDGNGNNFVTLAECESRCGLKNQPVVDLDSLIESFAPQEDEKDACEIEPDAGPCRAALPRFYFDSSDGACKKFFYGGCAGNGNNFVTEDECRERCSDAKALKEAIVEARHAKEIVDAFEVPVKEEDVCEMDADVGMCRALVERWFHNRETGECELFFWGGCGGNDTNFSSREKCESRCKPERVNNLDKCSQPAETGPCRAAYPRFFFNAESGECEQFIYGGCDGNDNNFETADECERACKMP